MQLVTSMPIVDVFYNGIFCMEGPSLEDRDGSTLEMKIYTT
jgi:hypothetical protein